MSMYETLIARLIRGRSGKSLGERIPGRRRRAPGCEALEGRQLLNAAWGQEWLANPAAASGGTHAAGNRAALIHPIGSPGTAHAMPQLSAQAQADLNTLKTDIQTLQSEAPADLTAKVTADKALIDQALTKLGPPRFTPGQHPHETTGSETNDKAGSDNGSSTLLTRAGLTKTQLDTIKADFTTYRNTLNSLDPTLQAKIKTDRAALQKDLGPGSGNRLGHVGADLVPGPGLLP